MRNLILAAAWMWSAMASIPAMRTTVTFGPEGVSHTLQGGDVTLVPIEGITTLEVTADQSEYDKKVTVSRLVNRINFRGSGSLFRHMELLNPNVLVEFPDAPEGEAYVNTLWPGQTLTCQLVLGERNTFNVLGRFNPVGVSIGRGGKLIMGSSTERR